MPDGTVAVQSISLHLEDSQHIAPLAVGNLAAAAIPLQLGQDRVFGTEDADLPFRCLVQGAQEAASQLGAVERARAGHKEIDLEQCLQVDDIERAPGPDGLADGLLIGVKAPSQGARQGRGMLRAQIGHKVGIHGRAHHTVHRAGQRTTQGIRHAQGIEGINHSNQRCQLVLDVHVPSSGAGPSARLASSGPSTRSARRRRRWAGLSPG